MYILYLHGYFQLNILEYILKDYMLKDNINDLYVTFQTSL